MIVCDRVNCSKICTTLGCPCRCHAVLALKRQFEEIAFIPETNRERALVAMLDDARLIIRNLKEQQCVIARSKQSTSTQ